MEPRAPLPTNGRIAAALIDLLIAAGERSAARRAVEAAGGADALVSFGGWLPEKTLSAMFRAASSDAHPAAETRLAQRVGRALMSSPRAGFFLCYSGVATPEKAYRRCDQILAREADGAFYELAEIVDGRARVVFYPAAGASPEPLYCALRSGMLEAIPSIYGLLPARVREPECVSRGAACCVYDVRWVRSLRRGLAVGAFVGAVSGAALATLANTPPWGVAMATVAAGLVAAAAGRSVDLARQLEAVAGARRGQLALLDQADRSLAEKMDQFARLEAAERAASEGRVPQRVGLRGGEAGEVPSDASEAAAFQPVDLVGVVRRAVDSHRSRLASGPEVQLELSDEPLVVEGEAIQLEKVVEQLLRTAAAAAPSASPSAEPRAGGDGAGSIRVSLRTSGDSGDKLELAVEDDGPGIEEETVDEVFDPFVREAGTPGPRGPGLALACRVVKDHGGELRLESAEGQGTRVTVLLPRSRRIDASA